MLSRRFCKTLSISFVVLGVLYIAVYSLGRLIVTKPNHPISLAIKAKLKQPEEWKLYTSQKGKFRVLIPGGYAKPSNQTFKIGGQNLTLRSFQVLRRNPISLTASYVDFPIRPTNPEIFMQMVIEEGVKTMKGTKLSSQNIVLGRIRGKELHLQTVLRKDKLPAVIRHRIYLKDRRLYQLVVVTPSQSQFIDESNRFMESFEITN